MQGFPDALAGKEPTCNARDTGDVRSIPGSGRPPAGGPGKPLQYFCLENPVDRGAWWPAVHLQLKDSDITEQLSMQQNPQQYYN